MGLLERFEELAGVPTGINTHEVYGPVTSYNDPRVTSGFGPRSSPVPGASTNHQGWDISGSMSSAQIAGQPATAAADGVVVSAGPMGGLGNTVVVEHPSGYQTRYSHLDAISPDITAGSQVTQGTTVGAIGNTGLRGMAEHLHFSVVNPQGQTVNPGTVGYTAFGEGRPSLQSRYEAMAAARGVPFSGNDIVNPDVPGFSFGGLGTPPSPVAETQPVGLSQLASTARSSTPALDALEGMMGAPSTPTAASPAPAATTAATSGIDSSRLDQGFGQFASLTDGALVSKDFYDAAAQREAAAPTPDRFDGAFNQFSLSDGPPGAQMAPTTTPGGIANLGQSLTQTAAQAAAQGYSPAAPTATPGYGTTAASSMGAPATPSGPAPAATGFEVGGFTTAGRAISQPEMNAAYEQAAQDAAQASAPTGLFGQSTPTGVTAPDPTAQGLGLFAGGTTPAASPAAFGGMNSPAGMAGGLGSMPTGAPAAPAAPAGDATQAALDAQSAQLAAGPAAAPAPDATAQMDAAFGQFGPTAAAAPASPSVTSPTAAAPDATAQMDQAFGQFDMAEAPTGPVGIASSLTAGPMRDAFNVDLAAQQAAQTPTAAAPSVAAPSMAAPSMGIGAPPTAPAATMGIGSLTTPSAPSLGIGSVSPSFNGVTGLNNTSAILGSAMGISAPQGASVGYSPTGSGFTSVYSGAPERVQTAATGPGLFGAMARDFGGAPAFSGSGAAMGGLAGLALGGLPGAAVGGIAGGLMGGAQQGSGWGSTDTSKSGGLFGGLFDGLSGMFGGGDSGGSVGGSSGGGFGSGSGGGFSGATSFGDTEKNGGRV